ncbi:MAG: ABC transporter substrate-binding protein [Fretibacterium sp.]|nr:ABC transporter substrate-binding protein [Fretibacterium sp.]
MSFKLISFTVLFLGLVLAPAWAKPKQPAPEIQDVIIVGDKVVDIAYNMRVLPKAMSVRCSIWEMCPMLRTASHVLGCPNNVTMMNKQAVPDAVKNFGIKRVIVEKGEGFCLYQKKVNPMNVVELLKDSDVEIEYVDFSGGIEPAITQTAKLLGCKDRGEALIARYKENLEKAQAGLPKEKLGKKVLILNGVYGKDSGKLSLRVEAPGLYSDQYLLAPLGCVNVGDAFKPSDGKVQKGYYPVRKTKEGPVLTPILAADPDVIVVTGNAYAVQKALSEFGEKEAKLAEVKAIKNLQIFHLPVYINSSVIEYPDILRQWTAALM